MIFNYDPWEDDEDEDEYEGDEFLHLEDSDYDDYQPYWPDADF